MKSILQAIALFVFFVPFHLFATPIEVLHDGGFETSVSDTSSDDVSSWTVSEIGSWAIGDPYAISGTDGSVSPNNGSKMMKLDPPASGHASHDVYQIVDVSTYASSIDAGLVTADLSAFFNSESSTTLGLTLHAADTAPTDFSDFQFLAGSESLFSVDSFTSTWQKATVSSVVLPIDIRYLFFGIHEPTGSPIAYVDDASLTLTIASVPEPAAFALMVLGLTGLGFTQRKRIR